MAEVAKGIIDIEINTGSAAAQLKTLQQQINAFNLSLSKQNKNQAIFAADYAKELQLAITKTGVFTAETVKLSTAAATLDKTLSKGRASLGQFFSAKFNKDSAIAAEVMGLAAERARSMQTQFIATSGAAKGMQEALAIKPMAAFSSEMAIAAQRSEVLSSMFKQGTTQLINFGKNVQWAGRQLMVGFTVPLTIFGNVAGKTFMELEKQMVAFKKVYGDIMTTPKELNQNLDAVKGLAAEYTKYGVAAKDTIALAAQAAAAGRKNAELTDAVAQSTRLATLGQMDQNSALETTISLQSAFRLSGQELADTINFLNMVENQTVVSLQDLAAAIPRVAPVVQGLGGDVKDLAVFLAAMQEGGVDAAEGANALKSGLASLINPTKQAKEMLNGFGINLDTIIQANKGDLMGTVLSFAQALQSLDQFSRQQALEQVFGKFQYAKLGALFDNITRQGSQAQQVIATMGYTTEQLGATADKELKTIEQSFGVQLTGAVERFKLAIAPVGEIFVKTAIPIINFVTELVNKFNALSEGRKQFIALATVIGGILIPAGTMLFGLFMNLVGTLLKMGQGITLFTKGLVSGGPIGAIRALTQSSKYLSLSEIDAAMAAQQLAGASEAVNMALLEQVASAGAAQNAINSLTLTYQKLIAAQSTVSGMPNFTTAGAAASAAKGIKTGGAGFRTIRRNMGGTIPGSGNTDTVPALLTPGEFVVNKEATRNNFELLKQINGGNIQTKALGGMIQKFNKGAMVRQLIEAVRRGYGSYDDILKGNYPNNVKELLSRWLNVMKAGSSSAVKSASIAQRQNVKNRFVYISKYNQALRGTGVLGDDLVKEITSDDALQVISYWAQGSWKKEDYKRALLNRHKAIQSANPNKIIKYVDNSNKQSVLKAAEKNPNIAYIDLNQLHNQDVLGLLDPSHLNRLYESAGRVVSVWRKPNRNWQKNNGYFLKTDYKGSDKLPTKDDVVEIYGNMQQPRKLAIGDRALVQDPGVRDSGRVLIWDGSKWNLEQSGSGSIPIYYKDKHLMSFGSGFTKTREQQFTHVEGIGMATGGTVPGTGNKDTVPAMLTPGEFVVNKEATKQNYDLLNRINSGSQTQKFIKGGRVASAIGGVAGVAGMFSGNPLLMGLGFAAQLIPGLIGKGTSGENQNSGIVTNLSKNLKNIIPISGRLATVMAGSVGAFAALGFGMYKLNSNLAKAEKAGAELTKAMYGSADRTRAMGEAFGRESRADAARRLAVEKAGGQQISMEAQQQSSQFMQSEAGKQMVKDIKLVKSEGKNAVEALRNQLASSVVAGVITTEEAKAIALDIGNELKDQQLSVSVSGELTRLLGVDGKDMLKNISSITAKISPKIDKNQLSREAQSAFNDLNVLQKFGQSIMRGGQSGFIENYIAEDIAAANASAFEVEAQALSLLNAAYQEGTIRLSEYESKKLAIVQQSQKQQDENARTLGFANQQEIESGVTLTRRTKLFGGSELVYTGDKNKVKIINEQKNAVKELFKAYSGGSETAANAMIESSSKLGPSIWGKIMRGEVDIQDLQVLIKLKEDGLSEEKLNDLSNKLMVIRNTSPITSVIDVTTLGEQQINSLYGAIEKIDKIETPITKEVFVKTTGSDFLNSDQMKAFLALPSETQKTIMIKFAYDIASPADTKAFREGYQTAEGAAQAQAIRSILDPIIPVGGNDGQNQGTGGGSGTDWKKNLMNRFDLVDKRLSIEAQKYQDVIDLQQRQNDLDQRNIDINNRALDQLSKQEKAINDTYDARISALDDVAKANDRVKQQEQSRIDLATALASGNIAAAASTAADITNANAAYQLEDARSALELNRQEALKNLKVEINGQLFTRQQIEEQIDAIEERIYQRNQIVQTQQDAIYNLEKQRLANSREREKVETRLFLLEQRKAIVELQRKSVFNRLSSEDKASLVSFKQGYNEMVAFFNSTYGENLQTVMYGGKIKKFAFGGLTYKGSNEPPPTLKMAFGNIVPGLGNIDRVPALLTPGEFVVRKSVAQANMPLLQALNNGTLSPKYSVPQSDFGIKQDTSSQNLGIVYNDTYSINVNVAGTNASPDDIANVVLSKLSQVNRGSIRGIRY